ncbi:4637_t:CDS:2 [Acaulospora colombiana]|uniref:4637_t:CDS:1 n=1 Tax=Acaulospora colombiana TaxID=27376 RepID=A0ACA9KXE9_9GLOM|nr:4637_t:CDS:2 [Acaulospora colombiana]
MPRARSSENTKRVKPVGSSLLRKSSKLATPSLTLLPNFARPSSISSSMSSSSDVSSDTTSHSLETGEKVEFANKTMRAYIILAESRGWKNADGSIFPISVTNLCNYICTKKSTNSLKSIKWYLTGFKKYHQNLFHNREWDAACKHPDVINLLNECKTERDAVEESNMKIATRRSRGIPYNKNAVRLKKMVCEQQSTNDARKNIGTNHAAPFTESGFQSTSDPFNRCSMESGFSVLQNEGTNGFPFAFSPFKCNDFSEKSTNLMLSTEEATSNIIAYRPPCIQLPFSTTVIDRNLLNDAKIYPETSMVVRNVEGKEASGEDVTIDSLPDSEDLTEFSVENAILMIKK